MLRCCRLISSCFLHKWELLFSDVSRLAGGGEEK
jgi:hypothetical protein